MNEVGVQGSPQSNNLQWDKKELASNSYLQVEREEHFLNPCQIRLDALLSLRTLEADYTVVLVKILLA